MERSVIGAVLLHGATFQGLGLTPEDFYLERDKIIWRTMEELNRAGVEIDYMTVGAALDAANKLGEVGGTTVLMDAIQSTPSWLNAAAYAATVRERAIRRRVIEVAQHLAQAAFGTLEVDVAISRAMDALARITTGEKQVRLIGEYLSKVYDQAAAAREHPSAVFGIPTGFRDWDKHTGGLQKGEVVKLSGAPGLGKSVLAVEVLRNAARAGHPEALFELEMDGVTVTRRLVSSHCKVPTRAMLSGEMGVDEWDQFTQAIGELSSLPVYICDESQLTTAELRAELYRVQREYGVEVAVVDYEYLLCDEAGKDDIERSKVISKRVHAIFKDLGIAGLVIDDMNKQGISGEGGKVGLSGSAGKVYDADQIIIMKANPKDKNKVLLQWEKLREGADPNIFVELVKREGIPAFGNYL